MWFTIHTNWWQIYAHREHRAIAIYLFFCAYFRCLYIEPPLISVGLSYSNESHALSNCQSKYRARETKAYDIAFNAGKGGLTLWRTHTIKQETKTEGKTAQQQQRQQQQNNNNNNNNNNERRRKKETERHTEEKNNRIVCVVNSRTVNTQRTQYNCIGAVVVVCLFLAFSCCLVDGQPEFEFSTPHISRCFGFHVHSHILYT